MLRLLLLTVALIYFILPTEISAKTITEHRYQSCLAHAKNQGVSRKLIYVAWSQGVAHTCLLSDRSRDVAIRTVLKQCDRITRRVNRAMKANLKCSIAVDRGRIVDSAYERTRKRWPTHTVNISYSEGKNGAIVKEKAVYSERPLKFSGLDASQMAFKISVNGITYCEGIYEAQSVRRVSFRANCFDQSVSGTAKISQLKSVGGLIWMFPKEVTLKRQDAWMTVAF